MEIIYKSRGRGKTSELIRMSEKTGYYILCTDRRRADQVFDQARKMGCNIPYPVTVHDYLVNEFRGSWIRNIYIDDADDVLQHIFRTVKIEAISMTDRDTSKHWCRFRSEQNCDYCAFHSECEIKFETGKDKNDTDE